MDHKCKVSLNDVTSPCLRKQTQNDGDSKVTRQVFLASHFIISRMWKLSWWERKLASVTSEVVQPLIKWLWTSLMLAVESPCKQLLAQGCKDRK